MTTDHDKLVTIDYFMEMLGGVARSWYYRHATDAGIPRRVYPAGGKPMLVLSECQAYVDQLKAARLPAKRGRGRPRKSVMPGAAA